MERQDKELLISKKYGAGSDSCERCLSAHMLSGHKYCREHSELVFKKMNRIVRMYDPDKIEVECQRCYIRITVDYNYDDLYLCFDCESELKIEATENLLSQLRSKLVEYNIDEPDIDLIIESIENNLEELKEVQ